MPLRNIFKLLKTLSQNYPSRMTANCKAKTLALNLVLPVSLTKSETISFHFFFHFFMPERSPAVRMPATLCNRSCYCMLHRANI